MYEPRIGEALEFANPATFLSTMAGEAKPFFSQFGGSQKPPVAGTPVTADSAPQGTVRTATQSGKSHRRHPRSWKTISSAAEKRSWRTISTAAENWI